MFNYTIIGLIGLICNMKRLVHGILYVMTNTFTMLHNNLVPMCYDFQHGITNDEENMMFKIKPNLFSIGMIILPKESKTLFNTNAITKLKINLPITFMSNIRNMKYHKLYNYWFCDFIRRYIISKCILHHTLKDTLMDETLINMKVQSLQVVSKF